MKTYEELHALSISVLGMQTADELLGVVLTLLSELREAKDACQEALAILDKQEDALLLTRLDIRCTEGA